MKSSEIIKTIIKDGWVQCHKKGSHCQFKHPLKKGRVNIPHPKKDLPIKTVMSIFKQAQIEGSVANFFQNEKRSYFGRVYAASP